jgi:2-oxoglutarate ferredoxin oxidoreductase subunit delta
LKTRGSTKIGRLVIEINVKQCKRCGICVEFCNRGVLANGEDGLPEVVNLEQCTLCRLCELRCPDIAIMVKEAT